MHFIIDVLKGAIIGIANIIPGVSGGTMMVSMNIYDRIIHAITNLFKEFKKSVATLLPIFIGMGLGIVGLARVIGIMFDKVPIQTNLLFIGLILGGLPMIAKNVKGSGVKPLNIIGFIIFFAIVIVLALLDGVSGTDANLSFNAVNFVILIGVGIIAAATMVIPGVSGSMMLMLLGFYQPVIDTVNKCVDALKDGNAGGLVKNGSILLPFGIGVVVGIFAVAKIIDVLITKYPHTVFWCIIGLIVASPVAIIMLNIDAFKKIDAISIITGIVAFAVGCVIAFFLGGDKKEENNPEENN